MITMEKALVTLAEQLKGYTDSELLSIKSMIEEVKSSIPEAIKGSDGLNGKDGLNGEQGPQGPAGQDGKSVTAEEVASIILDKHSFVNSIKGADGINGRDGLNGRDGANGTDGKDASAAEVAMYLKSSQEFLASIKGEAGPKGEKGDAGSNGIDGLPGKDGTSVSAEEVATVLKSSEEFLKTIKGETGATGPMGPAGEAGAEGPRGEKGDNGADADPALIANMLMENTEFVKSITGPQGLQGLQGETGLQGPKGDSGEAGPKGEKGDAGEAGPKGEKGEAGLNGKDGENADPEFVAKLLRSDAEFIKATTGPQGPSGEAGPRGEKGEAGSDGKSIELADVEEYLDTAVKEVTENLTKSVEEYLLTVKGADGAEGPQGPKGDKGEDADAALIANMLMDNEDFVKSIKGADGAAGAEGPKGEKGDLGEAGPKGEDGTSVHLDEVVKYFEPAIEALSLNTEIAVESLTKSVETLVKNSESQIDEYKKSAESDIDSKLSAALGAVESTSSELKKAIENALEAGLVMVETNKSAAESTIKDVNNALEAIDTKAAEYTEKLAELHEVKSAEFEQLGNKLNETIDSIKAAKVADYDSSVVVKAGSWVKHEDRVYIAKRDTDSNPSESNAYTEVLRSFEFKKAWKPESNYSKQDVVISKSGSAWVANVDNPQGEPGDSTDWNLMVKRGERGPQGEKGVTGLAGKDGSNGIDGVSIKSVTATDEGLLIEKSDGSFDAAAIDFTEIQKNAIDQWIDGKDFPVTELSGPWSSDQVFRRGALVTYGLGLYLCIKDTKYDSPAPVEEISASRYGQSKEYWRLVIMLPGSTGSGIGSADGSGAGGLDLPALIEIMRGASLEVPASKNYVRYESSSNGVGPSASKKAEIYLKEWDIGNMYYETDSNQLYIVTEDKLIPGKYQWTLVVTGSGGSGGIGGTGIDDLEQKLVTTSNTSTQSTHVFGADISLYGKYNLFVNGVRFSKSSWTVTNRFNSTVTISKPITKDSEIILVSTVPTVSNEYEEAVVVAANSTQAYFNFGGIDYSDFKSISLYQNGVRLSNSTWNWTDRTTGNIRVNCKLVKGDDLTLVFS